MFATKLIKVSIDVITGPSKDSLAAETAYYLAQLPESPTQIILLGRTESKVQPVLDRIKELNPSIKTTFVKLDLGDLKSVRQAVEKVKGITSQIDCLINSAGLMALEKYQTSVDGFEMQFAAAHIGHFLLTGLLLPQLKASSAARVVTLTSMGYEGSDFRFDDWNFSDGKTYDRWAAYGQAKTANIMFTTELARRAAAQNLPITSIVLHPGVIMSSGIMRDVSMDDMMKALEDTKAAYAAKGMEFEPEQPKNIEQGCSTTLVAALQPGLRSGTFLKDCNVFPENEQQDYVKDAEKAKKLWVLSEELVGEKVL